MKVKTREELEMVAFWVILGVWIIMLTELLGC